MSAPIAFPLTRLHENKIRTLSPRVHLFRDVILSRAPHVYGRIQRGHERSPGSRASASAERLALDGTSSARATLRPRT